MDTWLTVIDVAAALRVDKQTVYRLIWAGDLPYTNVSSGKSRPRIRIRASAVERFMASREREAKAA